MRTIQFQEPNAALKKLIEKYHCSETHLLRGKLGSDKSKRDRELFFGALFAESLNKISTHKWLIRMPENDDHRDCELLDHTEYENGQKSRNNKKFNHFLLQNVQITEHVVAAEIKQGNINIYDIFKKHLIRTKLSSKAGDYSGCILVFYLALKVRGQISLQKLREMARSVKQSNFDQIWIIIPNGTKYGIAELLREEKQFAVADFTN